MDVKIAAWNVRDKANSLPIQAGIVGMSADIVFLAEAVREGEEFIPLPIVSHQYQSIQIPYNDADDRPDRHEMVLLVRHRLTDFMIDMIHIGHRRPATIIRFRGLSFVGVHLDDRQETTRKEQARSLLGELSDDPTAVVFGMLNSSAEGNLLYPMLHPAALAWKSMHLPIGVPQTPQSKLARAGSLLTRLDAMSSGETHRLFVEAGFIDADHRHQKTMKLGPVPAVQLAHVLMRNVSATQFNRPRLTGSNNFPVTAWFVV